MPRLIETGSSFSKLLLSIYQLTHVISLFITRGNEKGQMYDVPPEGVTVGRDLENGICLTDLETSRTHCQIAIEDGEIFLVDLKSSNGTTVNGKMVVRTPIKIGDHIQSDHCLISFLR